MSYPEMPSKKNLSEKNNDQIIARVTKERDAARDAGDQLAMSVLKCLESDDLETMKEKLKENVRQYAKKENWNGPAGSFIEKPI